MTRLVLQFWLLGLQLCSAPGLIMNSSSGLYDKDQNIQHHPGLAQQNCEPCVTVSGDPSDPLVGMYR